MLQFFSSKLLIQCNFNCEHWKCVFLFMPVCLSFMRKASTLVLIWSKEDMGYIVVHWGFFFLQVHRVFFFFFTTMFDASVFSLTDLQVCRTREFHNEKNQLKGRRYDFCRFPLWELQRGRQNGLWEGDWDHRSGFQQQVSIWCTSTVSNWPSFLNNI